MAVKSRRSLGRWLQILTVLFCFGTVNSPAEKHQWYQVNEILGGSALLLLNVPPGKIGNKSRLDFQPNSGEGCELAVFKDGQWERSKSTNRFGQRLEMVNETVVRITRLEMEDSGLIKAIVRLPLAKIQYHLFSLTVYAPVPEPQIVLQEALNMTDKCIVALRCQVPGQGGFNISWKIGGPLTVLERSPDWYQLSDNGSKLQLSWHPKFSDSSVTCLVSNPVDQKNASFDLLKICPNEADSNGDVVDTVALKTERDSQPTYVSIVLTFWAILGCSVYAACLYRICKSKTKMVKRKEGSGDLPISASERDLQKQLLRSDSSDEES